MTGAAEPRTWSVSYDSAEIPLVNATRNRHWSTRDKMTDEWRGAFAQLALAARLPKGLDRIKVRVRHAYCSPSGRKSQLPDPGACFEAAKAAIDGLVDYGVVADDTGAHVLSVEYMAPTRSASTRFGTVTLDVIEVL